MRPRAATWARARARALRKQQQQQQARGLGAQRRREAPARLLVRFIVLRASALAIEQLELDPVAERRAISSALR